MPRSSIACALASALLLAAPAAAERAEQRESQRQDAALRAALAEAVAESESFAHRFDAEVWLLDMAQRLGERMPDEQARLRLLRQVHAEAKRAELPPEMVLAVIDVESSFERFAISHAGARGLMQVMPFWLDELGRPEDNLFDVATNLRYGCTILAHYLEVAEGRWYEALARYNGSAGQRRYPDRVFAALQARWAQR
jgi:soluble lytic murein transglycosylase-like protein